VSRADNYFVRVWADRRWLLVGFADRENDAKELGRHLWRTGAAGIKIDCYSGGRVSEKRTIVEVLRES